MKSSDVFDAIADWLESHGFNAGYKLQKRFWNETENSQLVRFMLIQNMSDGRSEEAFVDDSYRIVLISARNETNVDDIDDLASMIRNTMIDDYKSGCITMMRPIGGGSSFMSENRTFFEINFNTIISR
ncbi:hypothetical protein [Providencia sp. 2024EL-00732]|uniref:phage tail termination protein n=1 Tax=Providencia sp. 2024EL-00732 TaxID=3374242 RepID=UPI003756B885